MRQFRTLTLALMGAAAVTAASPALAQQAPRDQDRAYSATQRGRSMPLPLIERKIMPMMSGFDYLGPDFDGETYRLKFLRGTHVVWIDVDARTGRIVGRRGR